MVAVEFGALSASVDADDEQGNPVVAAELSREQAEELFTDLFIKLTDKSGRE